MFILLDNAESILDPRGMDAREMYAVVEELSRFSNICLCITSRVSTIPPTCETLEIPTLSTEAARDTFYRIYKKGGQSDLVNCILKQLDFHPLSITLLATVAHHNKWDDNRLNREWERQRTDVLHTQHDQSLAAAIELSLASPMFQELGPDARGLLGTIAFFPQGISEDNLDWLFPTLPNRTKVFDTFCILSLTHRSNGYFTMLAPLRDHLFPKDPASSPLLRATKDHYFARLSVYVDPGNPGFEDARWIAAEDMNVEHLLDVFTSIDVNSVDVWDACARFMSHLYWHKRRLVVLGPKIEGLPDDHHSKPLCCLELSRLFEAVGNYVEYKRLLIHTLELWRGRDDHFQVAETLRLTAYTNRWLGFHEEAVQQVKGALEIYEQLHNISGQARSWQRLSSLLYDNKEFDAAEEAASRAISLLDESDQFPSCQSYRLLGKICREKGETKKASEYFKVAIRIASAFDWNEQMFWNHYSFAELRFDEDRFEDAHLHIEHAKSYVIDGTYLFGRAMELETEFWYEEERFEEAKSEALRTIGVYERLGAERDVEDCRTILRNIEQAMKRKSDFNGELLDAVLLPTLINPPFSTQGTER